MVITKKANRPNYIDVDIGIYITLSIIPRTYTRHRPVFAIVKLRIFEDTLKLQKDIDRLGIWARNGRKWGMRFQPVKCNMMQLTNKHNKIQASYTLEGTVLENVDSIKYLGVTITIVI